MEVIQNFLNRNAEKLYPTNKEYGDDPMTSIYLEYAEQSTPHTRKAKSPPLLNYKHYGSKLFHY